MTVLVLIVQDVNALMKKPLYLHNVIWTFGHIASLINVGMYSVEQKILIVFLQQDKQKGKKLKIQLEANTVEGRDYNSVKKHLLCIQKAPDKSLASLGRTGSHFWTITGSQWQQYIDGLMVWLIISQLPMLFISIFPTPQKRSTRVNGWVSRK